MRIGVVIGRFQVANLHEGHVALLSYVAARCERIIVLVGVSPAQMNPHDPLPFFCRADSIRAIFPQATVMPLPDQRTDEQWSGAIDHLIVSVMSNIRTDESEMVTIYGGRDHSLAHYKGRFAISEAEGLATAVSGTELRKATELGWSYEFRQGMIFAAQQRFPTSFQAVDIAIIKGDEVLMGIKSDLPVGRVVFPGGFVDPSDENLEVAAKREAMEECGQIEIARITYVSSFRVNDWRYRSSTDKIMTALFMADYKWGAPKAGDDLAGLQWVPLRLVDAHVHEAHLPLAQYLKTFAGRRQPIEGASR